MMMMIYEQEHLMSLVSCDTIETSVSDELSGARSQHFAFESKKQNVGVTNKSKMLMLPTFWLRM